MKSLLSLTLVTLLFSYSAQAKRGEGGELSKAACIEKSVGDACSFESKKGERKGLCKESKKDKSVLMCQGKGKRGMRAQMFKELDLSKEQFAKLKKYKEEAKAKKDEKKALKEKIKSLREDVKKGFISNISDEKMLKLHREITANRAKLEEFRFSKMITMKNVLNEDQRKKFIELEKKRKEKSKKKRGHKKDKSSEV